jgi:hypothetical protein
MTLECLARGENLEHQSFAEGFAHGLYTLGKEPPGFASVLTASKPSGRHEPGVGRAEQSGSR